MVVKKNYLHEMPKRVLKKMTNDEKIFERLGGIDSKLDDIFTQTKKTNGRVTKLEGEMQGVNVKFAEQKGFGEGENEVKKGISHKRAAVIGALTFLLGSIVVPIVQSYIENQK